MSKLYSVLALAIGLTAMTATAAEPAQRTIMLNNAGKAQIMHRVRTATPRKAEAITKRPEGTVKMMTRNAVVCTSYWGEIETENVTGIVTETVEGNDGNFYLNSPVNSFITSSYIKGTRDASKISFTFPQYLGEFQDDDSWDGGDEIPMVNYYATMVNRSGDSAVVAPSQVLTLTKSGDTYEQDGTSLVAIMQKDPAVNSNFTGNAEYNIRLEDMNDKTITLPDGATIERWALYYNDPLTQEKTQYFINVAVMGKKVYLGGLYRNIPGAWVVGDIVDDDQLIIKSGQYLGVDEENGRYAFAIGATYAEDEEIINIKPVNEINIAWDGGAKKLSANDETALLIGTTFNAQTANILAMIGAPYGEYQGGVVPAMPKDPQLIGISAFDPETWEAGYIRFNIFPESTDGKLLDTDFLTYNIFFNDSIYTFTQENYMIEAPISDLPYNFQDMTGYDIQAYSNGYHAIYYYVPYVQRIGVRVNYTVDGVTNSTPVIYDVLENGINDVTASEETVVGYYDLMGRQIQQPAQGIYIKKTIDAAGNTHAVKVAGRK